MWSTTYRTLQLFGGDLDERSPWPRPVCPTCADGHVRFGAPTTSENGASRAGRQIPEWGPEWVFGTFHARGHCENPACLQAVDAVGSFRVELEEDWELQVQTPQTVFRVEYFSPPLLPLPVPDDAPQQVQDAVARAGRLLFVAPGLAATALRTAIEGFLSSHGLASVTGRGTFIPLDARIKNWAESTNQERVASLLLAVKWIGNEGSHQVSDLSVDDVLAGVELMDEAFHSTYVAPGLDAQAQAINRNKGRRPAGTAH